MTSNGAPKSIAEEAAAAAADESATLRHCDFGDFARHLGVDPDAADVDGVVLAAARHMFDDPLPPLWSEQVDEGSSRVYFFNQLTEESLWAHPQEALFRELVVDVQGWRPDAGGTVESIVAASEAHLRRAHDQGRAIIEQWSGPYDAPQGPEEAAPEDEGAQQFYFNTVTGESCWLDPRLSVEFDLKQRHAVLCTCIGAFIAAQRQLHLASGDGDDSSEGSDLDRSRTFGQSLMESLRLPLPARPSDLSPPASMCRPSHLPPPDTVRSNATFLSARSQPASSARGSISGHSLGLGVPVDLARDAEPQANHPFVLQSSE